MDSSSVRSSGVGGRTGTTVYLIGLSHDIDFRTNLILQEVAGVQTTVEVTVHDGDGEEFGSRTVTVAAGAKLQKNLAYFNGDGTRERVPDGGGALGRPGGGDRLGGRPADRGTR